MKRTVFTWSVLGMFLFGAFDSVRGAAAPVMQKNWHLGFVQLGTIFAFSSVGYLVGSSLSGFVVEKAGLKRVLLFGALLMAFGVAGVLVFPSYPGHLIGFLIMGLGNGWMEIGINGVIPAATGPGQDQSKYFNWLHGVYGVGACVFPVVASWVIRWTGGWRVMYFALLLVLLATWLCMAVTRYPVLRHHAPEHRDRLSLSEFVRHPVLMAYLIAITAYVMAEVGLAGWVTVFLVHVRHFSVITAPTLLAGFYFTFAIGRLTAHHWVPRLGNLQSIVLGSGVSALLLTLATFGSGNMVYLLIPAGFSFAVIFPTITAEASHTFSDHAGRALGLLFSASGIGSLAVNWLIGGLAAAVNVTVAFATLILYMVIVMVCIVPLIVRSRRQTSLTQK